MKRRTFLAATSAVCAAPFVATPLAAQATYQRLRLKETRFSGKNRRYNHARIADPTGTAPTARVERFELRGGDCSNRGDCTPRPLNGRMVARTRVERVLIGNMGEGDEGIFRYKVYLPSNGFTPVPSVGSTMGQLLWNYTRNGDGDSTPIFSLDTLPASRSPLEAVLSQIKRSEAEQGQVPARATQVGRLMSDSSLFDRWLDVQCRFRLSSGGDGYLEAVFDGRRAGRLTGPNMLPRGVLEVRYGIYQTGTNQYPGGVDAIPTQVALFAGVEVLKRA